jgi:hypothetical protein
MTTVTKPYRGLAGFNIGTTDVATPSPVPDLTKSLRENSELITSLCRFAEGLETESAVRRRWKLPDDVWEKLGKDDLLVEMIEAEKIRRVRDGSYKRERSQQLVTKAPDVLSNLLLNEKNSPKHRIDAAKTLDAFADPGPEAAVEQERVHIVINLTGDSKLKDPKDILVDFCRAVRGSPPPFFLMSFSNHSSEP